MVFIENIYLKLPIALKTIAFNIYGYKLAFLRYSGTKEYTKEYSIDFLKNKSSYKLDAYQLTKLKSIVKNAKEDTEFYKVALKDVSKIKSFDDFEKIPILLKESIRNNPKKLISRKFRKSQRIVGHTSGSTGTPLTFYHSKESIKKMYSLYRSFRRWYGYRDGEKRVRFGGRLIIPATQKKPPFWFIDYSQKTLYLSLIHMGEDTLRHYVDAIQDFRAQEFSGYPSSLYILAEYCLRQRINSLRPQRIITDSETLLDYQRETIERAFSCTVTDYYGISETQGIFAGQCPEGNYHVFPNVAYIEILDEKGERVPPGQIGMIHVTSLTNDCMPLIRYQVGDLGAISDEPCPCGLQTKLLKNLEGRIDDIITTPKGMKIGRLDHIFKHGEDIKEAQIIQLRNGGFRILLVPGRGFSEKNKNDVEESARKRLGENSHITIEIVDVIPKNSRSKFKSVIVEKQELQAGGNS